MSAPTAPKTRAEIVTDTVHGVKIQDPYRWLENQDSPETRKWLDDQMKYTRMVLDKTPGRDKIVKRLSELLRIDTMSPVANRGGRLFYWKRKAEQNQPVLFMREPSGEEKVLIDPNTMSTDGQISASVFDVSLDGKLLAYALQSGGEDEVVVKFRNLDTGADLGFELPKTRYWSLEIAPDKKDVYYVRYDSKGPRVLRQSLSNTASPAALLFGEGFGEERGISASLSDDGNYLVMTASEGWATSDVYVYDIAAGKVKPVAVGLKERFEGVPGGDHLFLLTTWKSPGGRVLSVPFADARFEALKEIVPERQATLESLGTAGGKIVLNYLENASSKVRIHNPDGTLVRELQLPGIGTAQGPYGEWDQDEAWYGFASFGQPNTWYTYKISTAEQSVFFKPSVPLDPSQTEVTQVWVTSKKDKTKVPMFLFHKKGLKPNAQTPVQLYGYGGFNVSLTPTFSATNQVWVEMGGVYAVANLRGGGEFGEKWHKAGMFENKQNVFDDFESSAEWLIEHGYGSKKTMSINGGSNGGLLVGTAMTQRPDLFKAVVCQVPLLDMVRYHQFKVAKLWVPEYGSSEDPKQFEYIFKYSPYHHVKKGAQYPAVMFVTGDSDTRVDPLHARKMTALVQANTGSQNPVLLHYDTKSGHAGGKPVNKAIEDSADILTFLSGQTGAKLP